MSDNKNKDIENRIHVHKAIVEGKEVEKTALQKALGVFISEDLDSIKGSIMEDYVKPRATEYVKDTIRKAKETIVDLSTSALEVMLFGDSKKGNKTGTYNGQKINYVSYYNGGNQYDSGSYGYYTKAEEITKPDPVTRIRSIYIPSYRKAEEVLTELLSLTKRYPAASVADYYQLVNMPTTKQDYMFGWTDSMLKGTSVVHTRDGYVVNLPKPMPLD